MEIKISNDLQLLSPALHEENVKDVLLETMHMNGEKVKTVTLAEMNHPNGLFEHARLSFQSNLYELPVQKTGASIIARMNLNKSTQFNSEEQKAVIENLSQEKDWKVGLRGKKGIVIDTGKVKMVLNLTDEKSELDQLVDPVERYVSGRGIVAVVLPDGATSGLDTTIKGVEQTGNIDQLTELVAPTLEAMTKIMKVINVVKNTDSHATGSRIVNWTEPETQ
jgi:hypothetical protein